MKCEKCDLESVVQLDGQPFCGNHAEDFVAGLLQALEFARYKLHDELIKQCDREIDLDRALTETRAQLRVTQVGVNHLIKQLSDSKERHNANT